jgi:alkaline phosphatase D
MPPQSMLGAAQKAWLLERLRASTAPWKLWGNSVAMLDWRIDFQNLPDGSAPRWPTTGYALLGDDDWSGYRTERREILDAVRHGRITGFASIAGDRHSFLAGVVSNTLPPEGLEPVGVEFVTGSVSAPGLAEAAKYNVPRDHPLRAVYLHESAPGASPEPAINLAIMHGVRSCLTLQRTGNLQQALADSNPDVAPHLSFADVGGHGYAVVRADGSSLEVEFVCLPRPIERSDGPDGGPLAYRVAHRVALWEAGKAPRLERTRLEGEPPLST